MIEIKIEKRPEKEGPKGTITSGAKRIVPIDPNEEKEVGIPEKKSKKSGSK